MADTTPNPRHPAERPRPTATRPPTGPPSAPREKVDRDEIFVEFTRSICPVCKVNVDAQVNIRDDQVYLRKRCTEHGEFEARVYGDAEAYLSSARFNKPGTIPLEFQTEVKDGCRGTPLRGRAVRRRDRPVGCLDGCRPRRRRARRGGAPPSPPPPLTRQPGPDRRRVDQRSHLVLWTETTRRQRG